MTTAQADTPTIHLQEEGRVYCRADLPSLAQELPSPPSGSKPPALLGHLLDRVTSPGCLPVSQVWRLRLHHVLQFGSQLMSPLSPSMSGRRLLPHRCPSAPECWGDDLRVPQAAHWGSPEMQIQAWPSLVPVWAGAVAQVACCCPCWIACPGSSAPAWPRGAMGLVVRPCLGLSLKQIPPVVLGPEPVPAPCCTHTP